MNRLLLFLAACGGLTGATATVSPNTTNLRPSVGSEFVVTVNLVGAQPFSTWNQTLMFDPVKVELVDQLSGATATFVRDSRDRAAINASGEIRAGGYTTTGTIPGAGELGGFRLKAKIASVTTISTQGWNEVLRPFGNLLLTSTTRQIPSNGAVLVLTIQANGDLRTRQIRLRFVDGYTWEVVSPINTGLDPPTANEQVLGVEPTQMSVFDLRGTAPESAN